MSSKEEVYVWLIDFRRESEQNELFSGKFNSPQL